MTTYPKVRLEADGYATLVIDEASGYFGQRLDLGDAETRVVVQPAPSIDGTDDTTSYTGARSITLAVVIYPNALGTLDAMRQALRSFTAPRIRPRLYVQASPDAPEIFATMRRSSYSDIIGEGYRPASPSDVEGAAITVQWVAPSGVFESSVLHDALVYAGGGSSAGRTYSLTFDRTYPASAASGTGSIVNLGNAVVYPIIRLYGPLTEPVIANTTYGLTMTFAGLTLAAGEYIEIDTRAHTILLNGDPANSRYDKLVFGTSQWLVLYPGVNAIRFYPATFTTSTTVAEFLWRDAYL